LYRSTKLKELPKMPQREASQLISELWNNEPAHVRAEFTDLADKKKAEHALLYPDYKYTPVKEKEFLRAQKLQREKAHGARVSARTDIVADAYRRNYSESSGSRLSPSAPADLRTPSASPVTMPSSPQVRLCTILINPSRSYPQIPAVLLGG
jgi:hypothetical protein